MESLDEIVGRNVAELRRQRQRTVRSLSVLLDEQLGHKLIPSGITKIEQGSRKPGPSDLVALALALGVNPNRLLLPVHDPHSEVALTPTITAKQFQAWAWADGKRPLASALAQLGRGDERWGIALDDFVRHARPLEERLREQHTAMQAAQDVRYWIMVILDGVKAAEDNPEDAGSQVVLDSREFDPRERLRRALNRLVAEVEDLLLGDNDGER